MPHPILTDQVSSFRIAISIKYLGVFWARRPVNDTRKLCQYSTHVKDTLHPEGADMKVLRDSSVAPENSNEGTGKKVAGLTCKCARLTPSQEAAAAGVMMFWIYPSAIKGIEVQ
jgi:hypothetical protein